jgi:hypothetical protein
MLWSCFGRFWQCFWKKCRRFSWQPMIWFYCIFTNCFALSPKLPICSPNFRRYKIITLAPGQILLKTVNSNNVTILKNSWFWRSVAGVIKTLDQQSLTRFRFQPVWRQLSRFFCFSFPALKLATHLKTRTNPVKMLKTIF